MTPEEERLHAALKRAEAEQSVVYMHNVRLMAERDAMRKTPAHRLLVELYDRNIDLETRSARAVELQLGAEAQAEHFLAGRLYAEEQRDELQRQLDYAWERLGLEDPRHTNKTGCSKCGVTNGHTETCMGSMEVVVCPVCRANGGVHRELRIGT